MRIVVIYREASEYRASVEGFMREYKYRTGRDMETMSPDTREGARFCQTYDILEYPTIIMLGSDGSPYRQWSGPDLPLIDEVSGIAAA